MLPASGQLDLDGTRVATPSVPAATRSPSTTLAEPIEASLAAQGMAELYHTIENPLVVVLAKMEHVGVGVDARRAARHQRAAHRRGRDARRRAARGRRQRDLNLNSPTQLRAILFDERRLSPMGVKKTKIGLLAPTPQTLEKMKDSGPSSSCRCCGTARSRSCAAPTARGSCTRSAPDGRIHATFNQTVARTGRLSAPTSRTCTTSRCAATRGASSARRSCRRRVARCSSPTTTRSSCAASPISPTTPGSIEAFTSGQDIHNATAARVFDVDPKAVTLDQRSKAKMVSYGLAYGMEAYGLGQRLNIATEEAAKILDAYFVAFPNVKAYMDAHGARGSQERLHRDAVRAPPADPRAARLELADPSGGGAPGDERRHPGPGRRHLQGRARCASTRRSRPVATTACSCSRCTTR